MMRYCGALTLLLTLSFAFSSQGFRLRRMGGHSVALDSYQENEEASWVQDTHRFTSSEKDNTGGEKQDVEVVDGFISSMDEDEATRGQLDERDAEEYFPEEFEDVDDEEPEKQDAEESSFIGDAVDNVADIDDEEHNEQDSEEAYMISSSMLEAVRRRRSSGGGVRRRRSSGGASGGGGVTGGLPRTIPGGNSPDLGGGRGCCKQGNSCMDCGAGGFGICHGSAAQCGGPICGGRYDASAQAPRCR